jgi:hypothetical protein
MALLCTVFFPYLSEEAALLPTALKKAVAKELEIIKK